MYTSTLQYVNLAPIAYSIGGVGPQTRYFRFEVSGKNAASTNHFVAIDKLTFTPR
jgi:hypothetical protein